MTGKSDEIDQADEPATVAEHTEKLLEWQMRKPKTLRYMTPEARAKLNDEIEAAVDDFKRFLARGKTE